MPNLPNLSALTLQSLRNPDDICTPYNPYEPGNGQDMRNKNYQQTLRFRANEVSRRQQIARQQQIEERRSGARELLDLTGEREPIVTIRSTDSSSLRVLAVMCYTRGWDALINRVITQSVTPSYALAEMEREFRTGQTMKPVSVRVLTFPMFMDDYTIKNQFYRYMQTEHNEENDAWANDDDENIFEFPIIDNLEECSKFEFKITDARLYCQEGFSDSPEVDQVPSCFRFVKNDEELQRALASNAGGNGFASTAGERDMLKLITEYRFEDMWYDLIQYYKDANPRNVLAKEIFNSCVYNMMKILNSCFYSMSKWVWTPCKANEQLGVFSSGFNVRYRGQKDNNSIIPNRYNSTSASVSTAYGFTEGESNSSIHVLLLSNQVKVLDVQTFVGFTNNRSLTCYPDECEILIAPDMNYRQIAMQEANQIVRENGPAYKVSPEVTSMYTRNDTLMNTFYWYVTDPSEAS
jgi:hypothetical protein